MPAGKVKVTITDGKLKVTFEGNQRAVEETVARYRNASIASDVQEQRSGNVLQRASGETPTERDLIANKRPANHSETIAVLAFALKEAGTAEFTKEDIRKAYIRAVVRPPKVVGQAIRDAIRHFDFIEPGAERGKYRLSHHGERTVRFDLPASDH